MIRGILVAIYYNINKETQYSTIFTTGITVHK